jgi:hypothetical protein
MRITLSLTSLVCCAAMFLSGGCSDASKSGAAAKTGDRLILGVEFPRDTVLRYKVISRRDIVLDLDPSGKTSKAGSSSRQDMNEEAQLVLAYKSAGPAKRGGNIVDVTCESATVKRLRLSGGSASEDGLASLSGKTFRINVSATGLIFETAELEKVIRDLGEAAFGGKSDRYEGRKIKNPDMVADFITVQWFMWDQQQSIPRPVAGVAVGEEWQSKRKLLAPFPFIARIGRDTKYTLAELQHPAQGPVAVIKSVYSLAQTPSMDWPMPYTGTFSQRGSFGFFQGYKAQDISGEGTQLFDVTRGIILSDKQEYTAQISAMIPFGGLGKDGEKPEPNIIIKQTITMELLPAEPENPKK